MNLKRHFKSIKSISIFLGFVLLIYLILHHYSKPKELTLAPPVVEVSHPIVASMVDYVTQTGTMVAYNSVNLVARVEGYLDSIEFIDGTFVKKGRELFVIQPEPYMEKLIAAKSTVAAKIAAYDYALAEYARQKRMYKENATSLNNVEKWFARTKELKAEIEKSKADEAIAAINYSYTHVKAPFDGRIGRHLVDAGNLVGNGVATNLATIEQIHPIYVYFNLNEIDLLRLRKAARAQGFKPKDINKIPVDVSLQSEPNVFYKATMDFVNTGLNASTGTMELRAIMDNQDYIFVPGLFVQVRVAIGTPTKQLTIPDTAILYDQIGPYVLAVNEQQVVELKRVTLGSLQQGMRAILKGLDAHDRVIVNGLQNASPGNKVDVHMKSEKPIK